MAIVLKLKASKNITLYIRDKEGSDHGYQFLGDKDSPDNKGLGLIMNDEHGKALLKKYPDEVELVPESKWPDRYKEKVKAYEETRQSEAKALFPDIFGAKNEKKKGEKK